MGWKSQNIEVWTIIVGFYVCSVLIHVYNRSLLLTACRIAFGKAILSYRIPSVLVSFDIAFIKWWIIRPANEQGTPLFSDLNLHNNRKSRYSPLLLHTSAKYFSLYKEDNETIRNTSDFIQDFVFRFNIFDAIKLPWSCSCFLFFFWQLQSIRVSEDTVDRYYINIPACQNLKRRDLI